MATPIDDGLRHRLREARRAVGLTQQQVAERLGSSRRAVVEWEGGQRRPHVALPKLAELYGVSTSWLLEGAEPASVELRELRIALDQVLEQARERDEAITKLYDLAAEISETLAGVAENAALLVAELRQSEGSADLSSRASTSARPRSSRRSA
jgi:transcriptional regulator with XRE-family HTH domain